MEKQNSFDKQTLSEKNSPKLTDEERKTLQKSLELKFKEKQREMCLYKGKCYRGSAQQKAETKYSN